MYRKQSILLAIAVSLSAAVAPAQFEISWQTIDGGGGMSSVGGALELAGSIGQPDALVPPSMSGGAFELTGGFWPVATVCNCLADMNNDGRKDGLDVQQFVSCITGGQNCACADVDQANGVTPDDISVFVSSLLSSSTCP